MDYKAHLLIGFISAAIVILITHFAFGWFTFDIKTIVSLIIIAYVYSLLPDLDHSLSTITWNFIAASLILLSLGILNDYVPFFYSSKVLIFTGLALLTLTFVCAQWAGHRGPIHTIWAGAIFSIPLYLILSSWTFCLIGFVCFYSHLCADGEPFKI